MRNLLFCMIILNMLVFRDLGALSGGLDSIPPDSFVDVIDNPDGTYTLIWEEEKENVD